MASRKTISEWFKEGVSRSESPRYMLVVCDTFSFENYPVYCRKDLIKDALKRYSQDMQKIMEVYDLKKSLDEQISQDRVWNVENETTIS